MALVSDLTTTPLSGLVNIDALLDTGPDWNWLTPTRQVIYYTFSVSSGNETGNSGIQGGVTAFNATQQTAALALLNYVTQLTGITFALAASGDAADLHFADTDIVSTPTSGLCSWNHGWSFNPVTNVVTSYSADAYVYLDNANWAAQNTTPVAGNSGYETLLHEIGHALGLKHPFEGTITLPGSVDNTDNTVMSYTHLSAVSYSTFRPYDVAALMWLYGNDGLGGSLGISTPGRFIIGDANANAITGGTGDDRLEGLGGNDTINGGQGTDTVVYVGQRSAYTITPTPGGFTISSAAEGTDTLSGVEFAAFSDQTVALNSGVDTTPPAIATLSPADEASGVSVATDIVVTFSEAIARGAGTIDLKNAAGTTIASYDAATSANLAIAGSVLTVRPSSSLAYASGYKLDFAAGSIMDLAGNAFPGLLTYNFTTTAIPTSPTTLSQVFISSATPQAFTLTNSGETVYGGSGREVITLASGVSAVRLDQSIDRLSLPASSGSYTYKQAGNQLVVYDPSGTSTIATLPIQTDADGTQIGFTNGTFDAKFAAGRLAIGGATVPNTSPGAITPVTLTSTTEPTPSAQSAAAIYMGNSDFVSVVNTGAKVYGAAGNQVLTIGASTTGIVFDQNVDQVAFANAVTTYRFLQTGNQINVYDTAGTTMIAKGPVQVDGDGTVLTFSGGSGSALISGGVMRVAGSVVSTTTPAPLSGAVFAAPVAAGAAADTGASAISGSSADTGASADTGLAADAMQADFVVFQSGMYADDGFVSETTLIGLPGS